MSLADELFGEIPLVFLADGGLLFYLLDLATYDSYNAD